MAIVENPGLSTNASGNVGGVCFSTYRGLKILKTAWTGTVPNTSKQVTQQGHMITVAQAWGNVLNSAERLTWEVLARSIIWRDRFGSAYVPNGYQLFMKWNIRRRVMGLGLMTTAPSEQERPYVEVLTLLNLTPQERIRIRLERGDGTAIAGYGVEYYKAGPYTSGGRHPREGEWRFLIRRVPPYATTDFNVTFNNWYWYRGRSVTEFGDVGNWFQEQIHLVL